MLKLLIINNSTYTNLWQLRHLGSQVPLFWYFFGQELSETLCKDSVFQLKDLSLHYLEVIQGTSKYIQVCRYFLGL